MSFPQIYLIAYRAGVLVSANPCKRPISESATFKTLGRGGKREDPSPSPAKNEILSSPPQEHFLTLPSSASLSSSKMAAWPRDIRIWSQQNTPTLQVTIWALPLLTEVCFCLFKSLRRTWETNCNKIFTIDCQRQRKLLGFKLVTSYFCVMSLSTSC